MKLTPNSVEFIDLLNRYERAVIDNTRWGFNFKHISRDYAVIRAEVEDRLMLVPKGPYIVAPCRGHFHVEMDGCHITGAMDEFTATTEAGLRNAEFFRDARGEIFEKDRRIQALEARIKELETCGKAE